MNYDELYNQFLDDVGVSEDEIFVEADTPATFGQMQFITNMVESKMMNALPEKEYEMLIARINDPITFNDAGEIINRILECQPIEVPIRQKDIVKFVRKTIL